MNAAAFVQRPLNIQSVARLTAMKIPEELPAGNWFKIFGAPTITGGLYTRFNALGLFTTLRVAWYFLFTRTSAGNILIEWLSPMASALSRLLAGAGKYSMDHKF
jgi:uncharacterized membrane protein YphA (DoxX/SURF4 family)